jgi:hypothetical protein
MKRSGTCGARSSAAGREPQPPTRRERGEAFAQGAIAHLVVVLQERHERGERQRRRRLAARRALAMLRGLALVGEPFGQCAPEKPRGPVGIVDVIAVALAGEEHVRGVVPVVGPLRRGVRLAPRVIQEPRIVVLVLDHQVHVALATGTRIQRERDLAHDMARRVVEHRVDGVQPQPVEVVLVHPVERVLDEEVAHDGGMLRVEVDARAHGVWCASLKNCGA